MSSTTPAPHASLSDIRSYGTVDATSGPRRSRAGVVSSLPEDSSAPSAPSVSVVSTPARKGSDASLLDAFQTPFARRSESRASLFSAGSPPTSSAMSTRSLPSESGSTGSWKERPLLPPAAQGKLLVPDGLTMRVRRGSDSTHSSQSLSSSRASLRSSVGKARSPLGGSVFSEEEESSSSSDESDAEEAWGDKDRTIRERNSSSHSRPSLFGQRGQQQPAQTRSWSYEAVPTLKLYPVMSMPGDGKRKRLFNFSEVPV